MEFIHEAVSRHSLAHPRRAAVAGAQDLTFAELDQRSARIAGMLLERGTAIGSTVGVLMPRGTELIAALMGILRAGAVFVPLDPSYPAERLRYIAQDAEISIVLTDDTSAGGHQWLERVDSLSAAAATQAPATPEVAIRGDDISYIIYTSGSTGRPKGVQVSHSALASLLNGLEQSGVVGSSPARVGWLASPSFDASVQQWCRLGRGDTVIPIDDATRRDPARLGAFIKRERITELDITPTQLELLIEHLPRPEPGREALRLLVGGEAIQPALWSSLVQLGQKGIVRAFNLYGPTEATVDTCITPIDGQFPHLGRPLVGRRVAVVDSWLRPVPPGVPGELVIAGDGLAAGYRGSPGLTADRYVADPAAADGTRMYRSGDRMRWSRTGCLEYLGRLDRQVKIRGFRVELGEVESALTAIKDVTSAIVVLRTINEIDCLVAYCVTRGQEIWPQRIRRAAAERLPDFMVPTAIVLLKQLPVGPNGKVDLDALPDPPAADRSADGLQELRNPIETIIADIWSDILRVGNVSRTDNFFDLGGNSLTAIRAVARLRDRVDRQTPMTAVFEYPEVRSLAAYLATLSTQDRAPLSRDPRRDLES
jgi:amino acid adenylation domain-containing protein